MNEYWDYLKHSGVLGQKWGVQNGPPYPLSRAISTGKRLKNVGTKAHGGVSADDRWLHKQSKTVGKRLEKQVRGNKILKEYDEKVLQKQYPVKNKDGSLNKNYIAAYNQVLARVMNEEIAKYDMKSPSGLVLAFVAKRGEIGVRTAIRSIDYDLSKVKRGVNSEGKIAYQDKYVDFAKTEEKRRKR